MNVGYIDDSYLQGPSFDDCSKNLQDTVQLFIKVGFPLNKEKSENVVLFSNDAGKLGKRNSECSYQESNLRPSDY